MSARETIEEAIRDHRKSTPDVAACWVVRRLQREGYVVLSRRGFENIVAAVQEATRESEAIRKLGEEGAET